MIRKTFISLAIVLMPYIASAQTSDALPFVRLGHDAVRESMAGAGMTSSSSIAWSSFDNSAAVAFSDNMVDAAISWHKDVNSSTNWFNAAGAWKIKDRLGLSMGLAYGLGEAYDNWISPTETSGTFTPKRMIGNIGASYLILPWLSAGANIHYATMTLAESYTYSAVSSDIFVMGRQNAFSGALGIAHIGSKVKSLSGDSSSLPSSIKAGLGYENTALEGMVGYNLYLDSDYYFYSRGLSASAGVDITIADLVSLRGGYHYGNKDCIIPSYSSAGLGVKLMGAHIDYAYMIGGPNSGSMLLSLGYRF